MSVLFPPCYSMDIIKKKVALAIKLPSMLDFLIMEANFTLHNSIWPL